MAVFRKILSANKKKGKTPNLKIKGDGACGSQNTEEFEKKKQEWQDELGEMSEFLLIKSAQEQKDAGVNEPIDSAFIDDNDGLPVLRALFDCHHFKLSEIWVGVEGTQLVLQAQTTEDRAEREYKKTMIRRLDLPNHVDPQMMHCDLNKKGLLTIEMPFHLPPQRRPKGPNVFPILDDNDGRRKMRLVMFLGPEFTSDDVNVESNGKRLAIKAAYEAEIGKYGQQMKQREFKREYILPDFIHVDSVTHSFSPDGRLFIELVLKKEKAYKCKVTSEEVEKTENNHS